MHSAVCVFTYYVQASCLMLWTTWVSLSSLRAWLGLCPNNIVVFFWSVVCWSPVLAFGAPCLFILFSFCFGSGGNPSSFFYIFFTFFFALSVWYISGAFWGRTAASKSDTSKQRERLSKKLISSSWYVCSFMYWPPIYLPSVSSCFSLFCLPSSHFHRTPPPPSSSSSLLSLFFSGWCCYGLSPSIRAIIQQPLHPCVSQQGHWGCFQK